jgi:hypothetical protein
MDLKTFICNHLDTPVVLIQGLGFVGSVMSLVVANAVNADYAALVLTKTLKQAAVPWIP